MNHNSEKEKIEELAIQQCLNVLGIAEGFIRLNPPEPDFAIMDLNIGVELTQPIRNQKLADYESLIFSIIEESKKIYQLNDGKLSAYIYPNLSIYESRPKINKGKRCELIKRLVAVLSDFAQSCEISFEEDDILSVYFSRVSLETANGDVNWQLCRASFTDINREQIVNVITKKNDKVNNYRGNYKGIWLLIHSTRGCCIGLPSRMDKYATAGILDEDSKMAEYITTFDKVFYLDMIGNLIQLKTKMSANKR